MKSIHMALPVSLLIIAGASIGAPVRGDDQGLQAILLKAKCVPSKVTSTDLAPKVVGYEVSCKGRREVLHVLCQEQDCRVQPVARYREEPGSEESPQ